MVLVDTSVWVEFFRGKQPYLDHIGDLIARNEIITISPIFGELLQGAKDNREQSIIMDFWNSLPKPDESGMVIRAGALSGRSHWINKGVGLIDAMIIVASRETSSFVWSLDKKLLQLLKNEEKYRMDDLKSFR
jgi:predicted nucleic acid-binding protein